MRYCNTHIKERTPKEVVDFLKTNLLEMKAFPEGKDKERRKANAQRAFAELKRRGLVK